MTDHDPQKPLANQVCDLLLAQISDDRALAVVDIAFGQKLPPGPSYFNYLVAMKLIPEGVQASLNPAVFQCVCGFFADLGIVCKTIDHIEYGHCFLLQVPENVDYSKVLRASKRKSVM